MSKGGAYPGLSRKKQEGGVGPGGGGVRGRGRARGSPASVLGALRASPSPRSLWTLGEVSLDPVTRPSWVFPQIPSLPPHGSAEFAAAGRAAVGPCRSPELLWRLRAACGLVSKELPARLSPQAAWAPARALGLRCFSAKPQIPSLPRLSPLTSRFVVYKLPADSGSGDSSWKGLKYKYMDQSSDGWRDGVGYINSSEGAVGRSLLPLYRDNSSQVTECCGNTGWITVVGPTG